MDRTTERVLSRMSFNRFCPSATKKVTVGQIKFCDGPGAGLGTGLRYRTQKNFEILKFDDLTVFKVFSDMNGVNVKFG